jgi:putative ABC transport system permease protein
MSSISLGVAALVAIDSFASNTQRSVREQARALLGGDIALSTRQDFPKPIVDSLHALTRDGVGVAEVTTFASMALVQRTGATRLAQIRGVTPRYPFYGQILTEPAGAWARLQSGRYALVDPSLLIALDARVGDTLALGFARFIILGTLTSVPGDIAVSSAIGPRVYIPSQYMDETSLLLFGSLSDRQFLLKLPPTLPASAFIARFKAPLEKAQIRYRTAAETEFNLTQAIGQLRDFLSVIGLVALLLGGIGVASGVNAFVMRKIDTVAVLRCLGATSRQVLTIYLLQAAAMGLLGAAAGALLGVGLQLLLPRVLADFLPVDVRISLEPAALLTGLLVGVWVALVFALRPLVALRNVSPLQTLRRESDADALRGARVDLPRILVNLLVVASVAALGVARADTVRRGLAFSLGIGGAVGVLYLAAAALSSVARRAVRPNWPFVLRQGVAALYRPGNQTRSVVLALGFGVFLMSTVYQVQHNLLRTVGVKLDASRANVVFFDVQEDQGAPLDSLIRAKGYTVVQRTPMVPMKISAINSLRGEALVRSQRAKHGDSGGRRDGGWVLRREFRSTYRDSVMPSEKVTEGRFHTGGSRAPSLPEVSLDVAVAHDLQVGIHDTITWNVQGVDIPTRVTSLREVNWSRFEPNFFVVFESRALAQAPKQFVILADVRGDAAGRATPARRRRGLPERRQPRPHAHPADHRQGARQGLDRDPLHGRPEPGAGDPGALQRGERDPPRAVARGRTAQGPRRDPPAGGTHHAGRVSRARWAGQPGGGGAERGRRVGADALRLQAALFTGDRPSTWRGGPDDRPRREHRPADRTRGVPRDADGRAAGGLTGERQSISSSAVQIFPAREASSHRSIAPSRIVSSTMGLVM